MESSVQQRWAGMTTGFDTLTELAIDALLTGPALVAFTLLMLLWSLSPRAGRRVLAMQFRPAP